MTKLTKADAQYDRGMIHSHCGKVFTNDKGYCKNFRGPENIDRMGSCSKVDGPINPVYWCNQFERASKK